MADVAQMAEHQVVALVAVGSNPIIRPRNFSPVFTGLFFVFFEYSPLFQYFAGKRIFAKNIIKVPSTFAPKGQLPPS